MFLNCYNVFEKVPSDMDVALPLNWCLRTQQDQTLPDGYVRGETNFWVMFYIFVFKRVFIQTAGQMQKVTKPNNFERVVSLDILMFRCFDILKICRDFRHGKRLSTNVVFFIITNSLLLQNITPLLFCPRTWLVTALSRIRKISCLGQVVTCDNFMKKWYLETTWKLFASDATWCLDLYNFCKKCHTEAQFSLWHIDFYIQQCLHQNKYSLAQCANVLSTSPVE